ncbi:MAG: alpha-amylase family protein, partial [Armatimonadota bacterium]
MDVRCTWMLVAALILPAPAWPQAGHHLIDIGGGLDQEIIGPGVHQAEEHGPDAPYEEFFRTCSFRWFANEWTLTLPVFPDTDNLVTFRARLHRDIALSVGPGFEATIEGAGGEGREYTVVVPAEAVGPYEQLEVRGRAIPPHVPDDGDRRERAWAVDWIRVEPIKERPEGVPVAQATGPVQRPEEHFINIGVEGDEAAIISGAYGREGYNERSRSPFYRWCSFRWFGNEWAVRLPVFPGRHNEITMRALPGRMMRISSPGVLEPVYLMRGAPAHEHHIVIPAEDIGDREQIELRGEAVTPVHPEPDAGDSRELVVTIDWFRIRPIDEVYEPMTLLPPPPEEPEPDLPLPHRLRGTESRPLLTDIEAYVRQARSMRCNVMTIGPMNGRHYTAFETEDGIPHPDMRPDFIPEQIEALHRWGIAAIGWLPFNVQDLREPEQCMAAQKYPQWTMQFLPWEERSGEGRVGMCVVSSPWREVHAGILQEAAALGLDGVFFDGFYLGGIPHPIAPGCVCRWCRERFAEETGLQTPEGVDWTDPTFKRWVRWRNEKLIETAVYFRDRMREVNPDLHVTCNYNIWPFGSKDWDTAIPLWSTDEFGVSQHAYTGRLDLEWIMVGFKARLSHDINPAHSDIWRSSRYTWDSDNTPEDHARQELNMRTFMLGALTYGTTPWHGGHIQPPAAGVRIHEAVRERERFFSQDEMRHIGVLLSQNTHDFWGHIPDTTNVEDYRDTILGAWLMLTENHLPFRFIFDNDVEAGDLSDYAALLLPGAACISDTAARRLAEYAAAGGLVIATGASGAFDEWGEARERNALEDVEGLVRLQGTPALTWLRERDAATERVLCGALGARPAPV